MILHSRLTQLGTASLFEAAGKRGAMDNGIRLLSGSPALVGRAVPVRVSAGDNLNLHLLLADARDGDVIVVDAGGATDVAIWGDVMTAAAIGRGYTGLVVDGAVRDAARITGDAFSVAARGIAIPGPSKSGGGVRGETVRCGGVTVARGDWVVGDADGVVVVAANTAAATVECAEARERAEAKMIGRLRAGRSTTLQELGLSRACA